MPNKASAKKAFRQAQKRTVLNLRRKRAFQSSVKIVQKSLASGSLLELNEQVRGAQKALDKAAKAGTIKPNTAARKLSRLMRKVDSVTKQKTA